MPKRDSRRSSSERGFSLVEILVVVAIIGLIAGVSVPAFLNFFRSFKVKSSGRQVIGDMQYARQLAITRGRDVMVIFRPTNRPIFDGDYDIVVGDTQSGLPIAGVNTSLRIKGPIRIADWVDIRITKPTGATTNVLPVGSINASSPVLDSKGNNLPQADFQNKAMIIFYPTGAIGQTSSQAVGGASSVTYNAGATNPPWGIWTELDGKGPRFTWMEINSNSLGKVGSTLGP